MPPEGNMRAGILPGCPSLDRGIREAETGFETQTFRSIDSHHLTSSNFTRAHLVTWARSVCSGKVAEIGFAIATIFEISRYMYKHNALLIRLLKILRKPTNGFAVLRAHQVGAVPEFPSNLRSIPNLIFIDLGCKMAQWLERKFTDRKVRGSDSTFAARIPLFRLGQSGNNPSLVLPSSSTERVLQLNNFLTNN
ncbi:hypothetical protein CSKR_112517 [Clonorchis sinensis]|uniref:Uncharacterized protein n=1 Tax=Clonorchis sinensis TaxID=79923 RepID=A0A419PSB7_CLOSI|nr:hypothetical protein CSKR_112517 [Clonorchis sinensis]